MRVGILTQYYPLEIGAPQARLSHLAREFVRRGHEVVVLAAMPNSLRGRIFPGHRGFLRPEMRDRVRLGADVDEIARTAAGKFRVQVCELSAEERGAP